ncbi:MAG: hypothetical protein ACLFPO_04265 [Spirochaetaceae bacterium]
MRRLAIVIIVIFAVFTLINAYTRESTVPKESTPADPVYEEHPDSLG